MSDFMKFSQAFQSTQLVQTANNHLPVSSQLHSGSYEGSYRNSAPTIPVDSILFGMAEDGKPLLLSLFDPHPGAILVTAERACGKTHFLKMMIQAAAKTKQASDVRFAVVTCYPRDFSQIKATDHLLGVWQAGGEQTGDMIYDLACMVEDGSNQNPMMLLIDGLDAILELDSITQENLAYIFGEGPENLVWPVLTANADMIVEYPEWLACFRTRIYGRVNDPRTVQQLTPNYGAPMSSLLPGAQFCMRENSKWLKFWLPTLPA